MLSNLTINSPAYWLKLYGVDRGSLKANLELILGSSCKRTNLTDRKQDGD